MIHALHGFFGLPSDWDLFNLPLTAHDVLKISDPKLGLWKWASNFNAQISKTAGPHILMGYSLGGRLALHVLIDNPTLWSAAILISTNLGLKENKNERLALDYNWASRIETESWDSLMTSWENQDVFKNSNFTFDRREVDFNRIEWASAMRHWSLGNQDDLSSQLENLDLPILWIAGKHDLRYSSIANSVALKHRKSKIWIASNAGHRVPWDCPELFKQHVREFYDNSNQNQALELNQKVSRH